MPAGDRFVRMPGEAIFAMLAEAGFVEDSNVRGHEVVYHRLHNRDPCYSVLVYTSVPRDAMKRNARGLGKDAIRVVAIQAIGGGRTMGVAKLPRVYRTGTVQGVLDRTLARMREAWAVCNRRIRERQEVTR